MKNLLLIAVLVMLLLENCNTRYKLRSCTPPENYNSCANPFWTAIVNSDSVFNQKIKCLSKLDSLLQKCSYSNYVLFTTNNKRQQDKFFIKGDKTFMVKYSTDAQERYFTSSNMSVLIDSVLYETQATFIQYPSGSIITESKEWEGLVLIRNSDQVRTLIFNSTNLAGYKNLFELYYCDEKR